jgi:hypothetical protein
VYRQAPRRDRPLPENEAAYDGIYPNGGDSTAVRTKAAVHSFDLSVITQHRSKDPASTLASDPVAVMVFYN